MSLVINCGNPIQIAEYHGFNSVFNNSLLTINCLYSFIVHKALLHNFIS